MMRKIFFSLLWAMTVQFAVGMNDDAFEQAFEKAKEDPRFLRYINLDALGKCPFCLKPMKETQYLHMSVCNHVMHLFCYMDLFTFHMKDNTRLCCPECRKEDKRFGSSYKELLDECLNSELANGIDQTIIARMRLKPEEGRSLELLQDMGKEAIKMRQKYEKNWLDMSKNKRH